MTTPDLRRYRAQAEAALRNLTPPRGGRATRRTVQEHRQLKRQTLTARHAVVRRIADEPDLLKECYELGINLAEAASALAYALMVGARTPQQAVDAGERRRTLGKLRTAKARAKARGDRPMLRTLATRRARVTLDRRAAGGLPAMLWAHVGLYQHMVKDCEYLSAPRAKRKRFDLLMLELLSLYGLTWTAGHQALRRYRRLLRERRGRLFRLAPTDAEGRPKL